MFKFPSYPPQSDDVKLASRSEVSARQGIPVDNVSGTTGTRKYMAQFPGRFMAFMYRKNGLALKVGIMALVFISGIYTKAYTGDFQLIINNQIGGIFYVIFGSLCFSILLPRAGLFIPVLIATGATCFLEFVQWFRFPVMVEMTKIKVLGYLFGSSFNGEDFIYYGVGAVGAVLVLWFIREN